MSDNIFNKLMNFYVTNYTSHVNLMKQTNHGVSTEKPNPYHVEGDVWTHTVSVLSVLKFMCEENYYSLNRQFAYAISGLCHDVGKVYTREVKNDRVSFYGHAEKSVQHAIDVAYNFIQSDKENFSTYWNNETLNTIINLVGNHMKFYQINKEDYPSFTNRNIKLYRRYIDFEMADTMGSYNIKEHQSNTHQTGYDEFNQDVIDSSRVDVWVYMGIPASGKDTHAKNNSLPVISLDDCRLEVYKSKHNISDMSNHELYKNAFKYCNENNINLNGILSDKMKECKSKFAVCNTHMGSKSRKKTLNLIKSIYPTYNVGCRFMVTPFDMAVDRDDRRKNDSKTVGVDVINNISAHIEPPTMKEGFDKIQYIVSNME